MTGGVFPGQGFSVVWAWLGVGQPHSSLEVSLPCLGPWETSGEEYREEK